MKMMLFQYAQGHAPYEFRFDSLDEALSTAWGGSEFGECYPKQIVLEKTGEIVLDHESMMRLANMLCNTDEDE